MLSSPLKFACVLLCCLLLLVAGCSSITRIAGTVVDGDGLPIASAVVRMTMVDNAYRMTTTTSADDGTFQIGISHGSGVKTFGLIVECDGYRTDRRAIYADDENDYRIVLERRPSGNVGLTAEVVEALGEPD